MSDKSIPAFPVQSVYIEDESTNSRGMALRDYFAAACHDKIGMFPQTLNLDLSGNMTEKQQAEFNKYIKASAKLAYQLADGMMEARNV